MVTISEWFDISEDTMSLLINRAIQEAIKMMSQRILNGEDVPSYAVDKKEAEKYHEKLDAIRDYLWEKWKEVRNRAYIDFRVTIKELHDNGLL